MMMTRNELARLSADVATTTDPAEMHCLAMRLLSEVVATRDALSRRHKQHADLLAAARATVASHYDGGQLTLEWLEHELDEHGQLPDRGQCPLQILADAHATEQLLAA